MPLIGVIILFRAINWMGMLSNETRLYTYIVVFVTTLLIPLSLMPILKSTKVISDFSMPTAEERKIPLLISSFMYLIAAFILQKIHTPLIVPLYLNAASVILLICALISYRWKISTHMAALSGLVGLILALSFKWMFDLRLILAGLILAAGFAGWARLNDNAHTPAQVYAGFGVGFTVVFFFVRFI